MFDPRVSANFVHPPAARAGAKGASVLVLTMLGVLHAVPARAAVTPEPAPASSVLASPAPSSSDPATNSPSAGQKPTLLPNPGLLLATMAEQLDLKPDFVVLQLDTLPITQHDIADAIRAMPVGMANLGFQEVYRRALDVAVRQKAMVLRARLEKLDKDPLVIHQGEIAFEHVLADAWLKRHTDAAVTDKSLHERYDRDIAGKPGPEQVRARVILVPTEAEANMLIQQIQAGADFGATAQGQSKDPSAASGGDLGYLTRDALVPEVAAAAFALSPGQMTAYPVASFGGYFIIRVEGRSNQKTPTFDEAKPTLERDLRAEAVRQAIGSLLSNVKYIPGKPGEKATSVKQ